MNTLLSLKLETPSGGVCRISTYPEIAHLVAPAHADRVELSPDTDKTWFCGEHPSAGIVSCAAVTKLERGGYRFCRAFTLQPYRHLFYGTTLADLRMRYAVSISASRLEMYSYQPEWYLARGWMDTGRRSDKSEAWILEYWLYRERLSALVEEVPVTFQPVGMSYAWFNGRDREEYCPFCNKSMELGQFAYLVISNNRLFPNTVAHHDCVAAQASPQAAAALMREGYLQYQAQYRAWTR